MFEASNNDILTVPARIRGPVDQAAVVPVGAVVRGRDTLDPELAVAGLSCLENADYATIVF